MTRLSTRIPNPRPDLDLDAVFYDALTAASGIDDEPTERARLRWADAARPDQQPPGGDWLTWLLLAGRGSGKTRTGAETSAEWARTYPGARIALIAITFADGRDTMVEGEALALDTIVPTPSGYRTMGELQVGDVIYGGDGHPCQVTDAYPVLHGRTCYDVVLKGGVRIVADAAHRWLTEDYATRAYTRRHGSTARRPAIVTTDELRATLRHHNGSTSQANHAIRVTAVHHDEPANLPIDPYVLGVWLGDGTSKSGEVTTADPEMLEELRAAGYVVTDRAPTPGLASTYGVLGLRAQLRRSGLLRNKHVPMSYLRASRSQRLALVQGLMDTDGYVSTRGQCEFVNRNQALADALVDLLCGLGVKASAPRPKATRIGTTHWLVKFTTTEHVFRLKRKLARLPERYRDDSYWHVLDVVPTTSVPVRCIAVDSPDRTFLVTRHHVRTHNSGLLECFDDSELRGGSRDSAWNRSMGELFLANGSRFKIYSSERPRQLRGPQHHFSWCDETASWLDAHKGTDKDTTWTNLLFGLRLRALPGWPPGFRPRIVASTTPKPVALIKVREATLALEPHKAGITQRADTVVTRASTMVNLANLDETYRRTVIDPLVGTRLARQELDAEIVEDVEGAFAAVEHIDRARRLLGEVPHLVAKVVAVDPATTAKDSSDETGIILVGADATGDGYVLDDESGRHTPDEWGRRALTLAVDGEAVIVVEDNQGGDMVEHVLRTTWHNLQAEAARKGVTHGRMPAIVRVHPCGKGAGKWIRALPIGTLYEQSPGRIHHVVDPARRGHLAVLEDQATTWTGSKDEESPDRVDALVHGLTWLLYPAQRVNKAKAAQHAPAAQRWQAGSRR